MQDLLNKISRFGIPLLLGWAFFCAACQKERAASEPVDTEKLMTQRSDSLTIIASENGALNYVFFALLMEHYSMAKEPYMEFRKGVRVESFNDTTGVRESLLEADYAIFFENQKVWEAKGNVFAVNAEGQTLETQQLFWNQKTKRIYSNVDTKVTQPGGEVIIGVGFESDEAMNDIVFRKPVGKVFIDADPDEEQPAETAAAPVRPAPPRNAEAIKLPRGIARPDIRQDDGPPREWQPYRGMDFTNSGNRD